MIFVIKNSYWFWECFARAGLPDAYDVTSDSNQDSKNIYKGISYRKFTREFALAEDIRVEDAKLENGLLTVNLIRVIPEAKKPKTIKIK